MADMQPDGRAGREYDGLARVRERTPGWVEGRRPSRRFMLGKAVRDFFEDECWDRAASMTFFGVLSIPPLAVALVSVLAVMGEGKQSTQAMLEILRLLAPDDQALETVSQPALAVLNQPAAAVTLLVGLVTALWTASGYVGAFGRAMNRVYGVQEGRPLWRLTLWHLLTTVLLVSYAALVTLMLVVSGPVAEAVGQVLGVGRGALLVWEVARWPVLLAAAILVVAVLYYATPNVRHPRMRWISPGSVLALALAAVASYAFSFYVYVFGRFEVTYGRALAGIVVFFIWLWIINMSLLLGAELDAEIERARQLQAGIRADRAVQVPVRDSRASERAGRRRRQDEARSRSLRESHGWVDDDDLPHEE
ncbi:YihY/virulence factor BrkB family protein [Georgenia sp. SYP-B2076]|uniref:YihY/virulence factor BrkB family protein n=1 Tax=Georgenia sp. SYP-B2076 TaxID=2495881 RepID=UPI000F8C7566|nr:YihY/virulence factor BrkB family protein [Georgenia sp. SYP-B2076]